MRKSGENKNRVGAVARFFDDFARRRGRFALNSVQKKRKNSRKRNISGDDSAEMKKMSEK